MSEKAENKGGRPRKYNRKKFLKLFRKYIASTDIPSIEEFTSQNWIPRSTFYEWEEFEELREIALDKKKAAIELGSLRNNLNPSQAIFSLKQLGFTDRQEVINHNRPNLRMQDLQESLQNYDESE